MTEIVKADENIFLELGFPAHEAEVLQLRADLMARLRVWIKDSQFTQAEVAKHLGITQTRVSNLVSGQWKKFSVDMLLTLAIKAGIHIHIEIDNAA
ncbi:helix-turn-helix domain-containing protein [Crenothrix sp.]|uniref:helix-turn-helix domain-containing protein n=1 Tax=Crenothrix sp. TaxID=3100433 RepID=UPI00374D6B2B